MGKKTGKEIQDSQSHSGNSSLTCATSSVPYEYMWMCGVGVTFTRGEPSPQSMDLTKTNTDYLESTSGNSKTTR